MMTQGQGQRGNDQTRNQLSRYTSNKKKPPHCDGAVKSWRYGHDCPTTVGPGQPCPLVM